MSNLEAQAVTTYERPLDLNSSDAASEPQSRVVSTAPGLGQGWAVLAMFRLSVDDLRGALARISVVRDYHTEMRFADGVLLVRKCSDEIMCQAAVRLSESTGESIGFSLSDDELAKLDGIQGELCVQVHGSGYDHELVFSGTCADSTESQVVVRCDPFWPDEVNSPPIGKVLPGSLLTEALRVIQPFARMRERSHDSNFAHSDLVKITTHGLGCISPDLQCVHFKAEQLLELPWFMPIEIVAKVRKFVRDSASFSICADDTFTYISDGRGAFVSWKTPTDVNVRLPYHSLKIDQFVARVLAKDIERALKAIKSRVSDNEAVAALRVSPDNESVWFETRANGQVVKSPSVPSNIERNTLDIDIIPQFTIDSLSKVFSGTKGPSLELRLYHHTKVEGRRETWLLRSIETYPLTKAKMARKGNGDSQPDQCRVTRCAASVRPGRAIQLG